MTSLTQASRSRSITYIALAVSLIAICSWIIIPTTVPFTMQTFAVFAVLALLGGKLGTLAISSYLVIGFAGLPVFSGFSGGVGKLLGSTGGYLIGFLFMGLIYWLITHFLGSKPWAMVLAMTLGLLALYLFGTAWFMTVYTSSKGPVGLMTVLGWCVFPFVVPDLVKLSLALLLVRRLRPHLHL